MRDTYLFDLLISLKQKCSQAEEDVQKKLQLSLAEYRALCSINSGEKISCKQMSCRMNLSVSRGSRVVDKLYEKGFIQRMDSQSDRRCKIIWLTKKGLMIQKKIYDRLRGCEERLLKHYPEGKLEDLKTSIKELIDNI